VVTALGSAGFTGNHSSPQFLCEHNPGMIAALGNWMK
jgi:hypothetical protein